jgi:hypothetical protein
LCRRRPVRRDLESSAEETDGSNNDAPGHPIPTRRRHLDGLVTNSFALESTVLVKGVEHAQAARHAVGALLTAEPEALRRAGSGWWLFDTELPPFCPATSGKP